MWNLAVPWWELVARAVVIYGFLLIILRLTGKRQVGQLAPFDLVLLLVLSNAVQNAMTGPDSSVGGGMILCTTLVSLNGIIGYATYRSKKIEALIEGRPQIIIHNGHLDERVMKKEKITHHELMASLRANGCAAVTEVHFAILENNGHITVQPRLRHRYGDVDAAAPHAQRPETPPLVDPDVREGAKPSDADVEPGSTT